MGEFDAIERLRRRLPGPPAGEVWIGDDTAVVDGGLLLAADAVVAGVHADLSLVSLADLGWKSVVANVSDVAAMGGEPRWCTVTVAGPPGTDLDLLYDGIAAAADTWSCPVVGGDLTSGPVLTVSVAIVGRAERPVLRSGARPGDVVYASGPLGASAAGLRLLRSGVTAGPLVEAHRRPRPRVDAGLTATRAGATAMIDVSDGLAADLGHVLDASGVGVELERVPVAEGATVDEALGGGEDYELVVTGPPGMPVLIPIGRCVEDPSVRTLQGHPLPAVGWQHPWS